MPALEIPGYYFDESKKRYFKIMPTGKYSLASINQEKREREKEVELQQIQEKKRKQQKKKKPSIFIDPSSSLFTFCQQRSIHSLITMKSMRNHGIKAVYGQIIQQSQFTMDPILQDQKLYCTNMITTSSTSSSSSSGQQQPVNEFVLGDKNGFIVRYGFQCHPFLHTWNTSLPWQMNPNITSLHMSHRQRYDGDPFSSSTTTQHIIGTNLGSDNAFPNQLWRLSLPYNVTDYQQPRILCNFSRSQGSFWTSYVSDQHDRIIVGGDKNVFILNAECELISQVKCPSTAVFATQLVDHQPHLIWLGCRNGDIRLMDDRCHDYSGSSHHHLPNKKIKHVIQFQQHSTITHLKTLDHLSSGHSILTASMNGSIHVWDQRFASSSPSSSSSFSSSSSNTTTQPHHHQHNNGKKRNQSIPIQSFMGHSNEHTRQLAFHMDPDLNIFTMSGTDHKVRLWSLTENNKSKVDPFWTSPSFHGHIPSATIFSSSTSSASITDHVDDVTPFHPSSRESNPGILICSQPQQDSPSLHWYSIPS